MVIDRHLGALIDQQRHHGRDIAQMGHTVVTHLAIDQNGGRQQRQRGILRPASFHRTAQGTPTVNNQLFHSGRRLGVATGDDDLLHHLLQIFGVKRFMHETG